MPVTEDDSDHALAKAKESILLMKKKMLRSHDLILQYNNKLKECERLKEDFCLAQEEAAKLKRENNVNLTKVIKLETQITDYEKNVHKLERIIEDKDIQVASEKSHTRQLECKLKAVKEKHEEYTMEEELKRSSLEVKVKELVQELKTLKKTHATEMAKLERSLTSPQGKKGKKVIEVVKKTSEIGVNTMPEQRKPIKPVLVDKSVLTNEFYNIVDNQYPLFCGRCDNLMQPKLEKICGMMSHPPPVSHMLSPVRDCDWQRPNHNDLNYLYFNEPFSNVNSNVSKPNEPMTIEMNLNDTTNSQNHVIPMASQSTISRVAREIQIKEIQATSVDSTVPEFDNLRRKVATLERIIKKQRKQKTLDNTSSSANCCSHPHSMNCCSHSSNPPLNVLPNAQTDVMTEFMSRIINLSNKTDCQRKKQKFVLRRKERDFRDKKAKIKQRKHKRMEILTKSTSRGINNWEVDSCESEIETRVMTNSDTCDTGNSHLLRTKRNSIVDSCDTLFSIEETEKLSQNSSDNIIYNDKDYNSVLPIADSIEPIVLQSQEPIKSRKRGRPPLVGNVGLHKNKPIDSTEISVTKKIAKNSKIRSKRLRKKENANDERSLETSDSEQSITSEKSVVVRKSVASSKNLPINDDSDDFDRTIGMSNDHRHDVPLEINSDSDSTNLRDRTNRKNRERSNFPKSGKTGTRSKLMGRLRSLKKNTVMTATIGNNSSTIRATRSLSRTKFPKRLVDEDSELPVNDEKDNDKTSSIFGHDNDECLPVKKQRIAHVPKTSTNSQIDEQEFLTNSSIPIIVDRREKIGNIANDDTTIDRDTIAQSKGPLTRRSAIEKLSRLKSNNAETPGNVKNLEKGSSTNFTDICRRPKTSAKTNAIANELTSTDLGKEENAIVDAENEFVDNNLCTQKIVEASDSSNLRITDFNNVIGNSKNSSEDIGVVNNDAKSSELSESNVTTKCDATELVDRKVNDSIVRSVETERSSTPIIFEANNPEENAPVDKTEASTSIEDSSVKTTDTSIPISLDTDRSTLVAIENDKSNENVIGAKNSIATDETDVAKDETKPIESPDDRYDVAIGENCDKSAVSKIAPNVAEDDKTISIDPKKSVESTTISTTLSRQISTDFTAISSEKKSSTPTARSTSTDERSSSKDPNFFNESSFRDDSSDAPIETPIERNLITYDTFFGDSSEDESDKLGTEKIANSQSFVEKKNVNDFVGTTNVVKDLRSRQVVCNSSTFVNNKNLTNERNKFVVTTDDNCSTDRSYFGVRSLGTLLNHHLREAKQKSVVKTARLRKAGAIKLQETAENNVKMELNRLVESEEWTNELHNSVIGKLRNVTSERTVAKSIVDFLIERASFDEPLDRTHTPPAPIMTRTQQRIVTMIDCLQRDRTTSCLFDLVQNGIEYTVFKFGSPHTIEIIEYLVRTFTVIARIRKDRERMRIFCYDACYWLGRRALPLFTVILRIWLEVLPKYGDLESELPNSLVHVINLEKIGKDPFPGVLSLKKLITDYHKYPQNLASSGAMMDTLIKALHEKYSGDLEAAILLISKKEGPKWALENVIEKGLMKVIQDDGYQWKYEVLTLLGSILRNFPISDTDKTVQKYVILLCRMLDSGEGSPDKQEGIVSAILSLVRFTAQFGTMTDSLLKWMPQQELRSNTLEQLDSFFKSRSPVFWNGRLEFKKKRYSKRQE